jgi:hypothetical protein
MLLASTTLQYETYERNCFKNLLTCHICMNKCTTNVPTSSLCDRDFDIECTNSDCPIFYSRISSIQKLKQQQNVAEIVKQLWKID